MQDNIIHPEIPMEEPQVDEIGHEHTHGNTSQKNDTTFSTGDRMKRMMEEDTEYYVGITYILEPILAPRITRKVICTCGKTSDESSSLGLSFSLKRGLVPIVSVYIDSRAIIALFLR